MKEEFAILRRATDAGDPEKDIAGLCSGRTCLVYHSYSVSIDIG
jgi:hypothetical protein